LSEDVASAKKRWKGLAKQLIRLAILTVVCIGVWHSVEKGLNELREKQFSWSQVRGEWLLVAAGAYLLGMLPCWWFWHRTLRALGQHPGRFESLRAFYIGHLGKYVPGKAMVVVLRTGLIRGPLVDTTVAATSVFVETLTMMAVGASVAAAMIALLYRQHEGMLWLAIGLMICAGVPTLPPVFRRIVGILGVRKFHADIGEVLHGLDFRLMLYGWVTVAIGWFLLGFSLWAVLRSIPSPEILAHPVALADWPLTTACVALAMVAGFLSLIPGGIGIREAIVMALLAGPLGEGAAMVSAVLLRLVWLLAEVVLATILYWMRPRAAAESS
jgi:uncharacterized membrane protein YbhN (UPF0104 family)